MYYAGAIIIFIISVMANAGGIGGGGPTIPFIAIFFAISIKESVPIANISSTVSALIRFIINFYSKHPTRKQRLIIDYELVQLTMPLLYLGTFLGV